MADIPQKKSAGAQLRYARIPARKARLVADLIRGMAVEEAESHLGLMPHHAARLVLKLLRSAAKNGAFLGFNEENLFISKILVGDGPILKRWMPRARGATSPIYKRTSHISIELTPVRSEQKVRKIVGITMKKDAVGKSGFGELEEREAPESSREGEEKKPLASRRPELRASESEQQKKGLRRGFLPKIFRRKSV